MFGSRFNIEFEGNNTYLIYKSGKNNINYVQLDMFRNELYKDYFLVPTCTKNSSTSRISFDISGLTSLSEYIRSRMEQKQYFDIIMGIQKVASFCQKSSLPFENLVCDLKYIYYHYELKKILMVFVPVQSDKEIKGNIPECLVQLHKKASDVIIRDGNFMNKYEEYLRMFQGKKSNMPVFSPDSLQHFFNENQLGKPQAEYKQIPKNPSNIVYVSDHRFDINQQIKNSETINNNINNQPTKNDIQNNISPIMREMHTSGNMSSVMSNQPGLRQVAGTFIPPAENRQQQPAQQPYNAKAPGNAYLEDKTGAKIYIENLSFTIGRCPPKSLVIDEMTISGNHAEIRYTNNAYYLRNLSQSNGTFVNEDFMNRISEVMLNDGDRIYFYRTRYVFHCPSGKSKENNHTVIVQPSHTVVVAPSQQNTRPLAYIRKLSDNSVLRVTAYPFTDKSIPGVIFTMGQINGRSTLFMENTGCQSLILECTNIGINMKTEIFSGCTLFINNEQYTFIIEN